MSTSTIVFLLLRAGHVLFAAVWVGAAVFLTTLLMPAVGDAGPAGGPVIAALERRRFHPFMASISGLTVLTGIYLYWRFTAGFDPSLSATRGAMVFGTGGLAGIIAFILGGAVVGRNAKKMGPLAARLAQAEPPQRPAIAAELAAVRQKVKSASILIIVLQFIALTAMAVGHYV